MPALVTAWIESLDDGLCLQKCSSDVVISKIESPYHMSTGVYKSKSHQGYELHGNSPGGKCSTI